MKNENAPSSTCCCIIVATHEKREREREREASVCLWLEGRLEAENKDFLAREEEKG